jgi:hypothetical protein
MTALAGWAATDIGVGVLLGVLIGIVFMLVRIVTPWARPPRRRKDEDD